MLVDPKLELYTAFGLRKSLAKVWGIASLVYYAEQLCEGKALVKAEKDDDLHQMGGNFIIDRHGNMAFVYCSKISTDRPAVQHLVDVMKSINSKL